MPERSKGVDLRSTVLALVGSNPTAVKWGTKVPPPPCYHKGVIIYKREIEVEKLWYPLWGFSSYGRALALHARGNGIDTHNLHQIKQGGRSSNGRVFA